MTACYGKQRALQASQAEQAANLPTPASTKSDHPYFDYLDLDVLKNRVLQLARIPSFWKSPRSYRRSSKDLRTPQSSVALQVTATSQFLDPPRWRRHHTGCIPLTRLPRSPWNPCWVRFHSQALAADSNRVPLAPEELPRSLVVMKFGGTSLASASHVLRCANIVRQVPWRAQAARARVDLVGTRSENNS